MKSVTRKPSKFDEFVEKLKKESPIHISKRIDAPKWLPFVVRIGAIVLALFVCAIVTAGEGGSFGGFFVEMFRGSFGQSGSIRTFINLLQEMAILLLIALAITPAFKMKFWNIGAEGQVLMGGLMCVVAIKYLGGKISDGGVIVVALVLAVAMGAVWAAIPAIFKAKWNTNETLFTLMLNYVAMGLVALCIYVWQPNGSAVLGILKYGHFPTIGGQPYILNIIIVAVITLLVWVYLKFSKHGYEISVVGESVNTAKYVGISVPKVIIRTMLLSGAICGIAGWLLVNGTSFSITTETAGGRGFTAILVSWLGHFNPLAMVVTSFLVAFITKGASQVASIYKFGGTYPEILTGVFFFIVIASEFIVNYKVKFNLHAFKKHKNNTEDISEDSGDVTIEKQKSEDIAATDAEGEAVIAPVHENKEEVTE